jgi:hypothetical protein
MSAALAGQTFPAQVLPGLQGNGSVRQRSISTDLIFCYILYQDKSSSLRGNERLHAISKLCLFALYSLEIASFLAMTIGEEYDYLRLVFVGVVTSKQTRNSTPDAH